MTRVPVELVLELDDKDVAEITAIRDRMVEGQEFRRDEANYFALEEWTETTFMVTSPHAIDAISADVIETLLPTYKSRSQKRKDAAQGAKS